MDDTIRNLEVELATLKRQREEDKAKAKTESTWVSVKKRLPYNDTIRVIVWANGEMVRCWHKDSNWYTFDGTWFFTHKDRLDGVTHWIPVDWMEAKEWPLYGPGIANRLRHHWTRFTGATQSIARDLRAGSWGKKAQLSNKPVFFRDVSGKLTSGFPENLPAPKGYEKIVCGSAFEAERYSAIQRRQEGSVHQRQQEERGQIEGQFADSIRSEMRTKMANARNNLNRDFMRRALQRMDGKTNPTSFDRESYLHSEGFENKH